MMPVDNNDKKLRGGLSRVKLILPTILGLGMIYYLYKDELVDLEGLEWTSKTTYAFMLALLMVVIRDAAYVVRIKILSLGELSWKSSFNSVMLWEFASALTPTVLGGSAFAVLILKREGLSLGRSVATVLITVVMDEIFYVIAVPVVVLFVGFDAFFPTDLSNLWLGESVKPIFFSGYILTCIVSAVVLSALFISPKGTGKVIGLIFKLPIINRWSYKVGNWTEDWSVSSKNLKGKSFKFWAGAGGATLASWSARFLTLNAILYAFVKTVPHGEIVAKQLAMWIVMLLSPTPGASGLAECYFEPFIGPAVPLILETGKIGLVLLAWRFLTYFIYLIIGALIGPKWLART